MKTTEAELIIGAVAAMRHMGVGVTPAHVETAVNAAQGGIGGEDSAATLKRLRARVKELDAIIDDARATTEARIKALLERGLVVESITALEVALAGKNVTVAQAVAGVNALVVSCQTRERQPLTERRQVVGAYLTHDGEVIKSIRTAPPDQAPSAPR